MARRMGSAWLLLVCLVGSVLITAALIAAIVSFYTSALPGAVRQDLADSGKMSVVIAGSTTTSLLAPQTSKVEAWSRKAMGAVPYQLYRTVLSDDLGLPGGSARDVVPVLQAAAPERVETYATLAAGSWPARPAAGQPIPVALPVPSAAALNLKVGSVLSLPDRTNGALVKLKVTGLFRRRDPNAQYWAADPIGPSGVSNEGGFASFGPALVNPAAFSASNMTAGNLSFVILPGQVTPNQMAAVAGRVSAAASSISNTLPSMTVSTAMPEALLTAARGLAAARSLLVISALQLLLLAAAALALAGRLLINHREDESALLTARGAARWQLIKPNLAEAILACAAAAAAGAVVGVRLAAGLLARIAGHGATLATNATSAWSAVAVVFVFCLVIVIWPALRPESATSVRVRRGRQARVMGIAAAGVDIALVVLALLSVLELRTYSAARAATGGGVNPVIAAAPALALAGLAIIPLRLLPVAARGLERLSTRTRRFGAAMANWEISRRPIRQSGPVLLVILAVGTGTLALAQYQSWHQSVNDQAAFTAGAQVRVNLTQALAPARAARISRLPGVRDAMAVSQIPYGAGGDELLAVDAHEAPGVVQLRPDLATVPVARLWRDITPAHQVGMALPGRPARVAIGIRATGSARFSATATVQDASGATYSLPAGTLVPDGKQHELTVSLKGAHYPVRLTGISLTYAWPQYSAASATPAVVSVTSLADSSTSTGGFAAPFATGPALAHWVWTTSAPDLSFLQRLGVSKGARAPVALRKAKVTSTGLHLTFNQGNGPNLTAKFIEKYGLTGMKAGLMLAAPVPAGPIPAIASKQFLADNSLRVGSVVSDPIGAGTVLLRIVAAVRQFPTVRGAGAIVVDQAAVQDALAAQGAAPLAVSQWWLHTAGGAVPPGLPAGAGVTSTTGAADALRRMPLSVAPVEAAVAISAAAALLAAFGFCISVAASARSRRSQRALLSALGVPSSAQARLFCLEEFMLSVPAALVGIGVGVALAHVLIPALTLAANAGTPIPPVVVAVPLGWVLGLALVVSGAPVVAAAFSAVREPDPAAELRAAEAG